MYTIRFVLSLVRGKRLDYLEQSNLRKCINVTNFGLIFFAFSFCGRVFFVVVFEEEGSCRRIVLRSSHPVCVLQEIVFA